MGEGSLGRVRRPSAVHGYLGIVVRTEFAVAAWLPNTALQEIRSLLSEYGIRSYRMSVSIT